MGTSGGGGGGYSCFACAVVVTRCDHAFERTDHWNTRPREGRKFVL